MIDKETGTLNIALDDETLDALVNDALAEAQETDKAVEPVVTLDVSQVEDATQATVTIKAARAFSQAETDVTIKLPNAEITLSPETLGILGQTTDLTETPITVEASRVPMQDLQGMQAAQVKGFETVINVDIFVGDEKTDVPVIISLPYKLKQNEDPKAVGIWYLADDGALTKLKAVYDEETGMITCEITHQSYYVAGYDPVALWINMFDDVNDSLWYYEAVAYVNYYGIFTGYGDGTFGPTDTMTRAMFVTALWKMENGPQPLTAAGGSTIFPDVLPGMWYYDAIMWAAENGIINNEGGGFTPETAIIRQEMAAIMLNYAVYKGYEIPSNREMPAYTDYQAIDMWAENAARKLSEAGVMAGENNMFQPNKNATRAEVAQLFKNFLRLIAGK